jgi:excisionase family DNA binding protein
MKRPTHAPIQIGVTEAARLLGYSRDTLIEWIASDPTFPARRKRPGAKYQIRLDELDAWAKRAFPLVNDRSGKAA